MDRLFTNRKRLSLLLILLGVCLAPSPRGASAAMEDYCQYPPYVFQSVIPSVNLLVSNSSSMLNFAYYDGVETLDDPTDDNLCDDAAAPCTAFDPAVPYYGYFNSDYWYTYQSNRFQRQTVKSGNKPASYWDGNFLNWLTMRRIDVLRKVLTGGTMEGQAASSSTNGIYKSFHDSGSPRYTPFDGPRTYTFNVSASNQSQFSVSGETGSFRVQVNESPPEGVLQTVVGAKARIALTFYNFDDEGGQINPETGTANPLSSLVNRINGPSNVKGGDATAPLAEALWTVVGSFAQVAAMAGGPGPQYHNGDYSTSADLKDPYFYNGHLSRCVEGAVVVISDGEPCADGNLPLSVKTFAAGTPFDCVGTNCLPSALFPLDNTAIPQCAAGGAEAGAEDVALLGHTTDLRSSSVGKSPVAGNQNLDFFFVRAFGRGSNLLKYAAINGTFVDRNANGRPDDGEYDLSEGYYEATRGQDLEGALADLFSKLIRRATSGTAASVLASGEGSGANLLQAVFYPRRRFGNDIVEWTGSLQNLWYFVDPFFANASIREDSDGDRYLDLTQDKAAFFFFDPATDTTKVNLFGDSNSDGVPDGTATAVALEDIKSIWEAGDLLHERDTDTRTIFTSVTLPTHLSFTTSNATTLRTLLNAGSDAEASAIIGYVRGKDDVNNDNVIDYRQRTVVVGTDNTVWKLGDIINSTPRIAASFPLNTYDRVYGDTTYGTFIQGSTYRNRGMVFAGGNDGMLHAFKLGKLEFAWGGQSSFQKARLLPGSDNAVLGYEKWGFIPKNSLPYLKYMLDNNYCHLYYTDLSPYLFDASIGAGGDSPTTTRDETKWRTVLIGGMRYGGACRYSTSSCAGGGSDCVKSPLSDLGLSSYFALEVTDPNNPSLLWEFSDENLGFTTTGPAIVRIHARNSSSGTPVPDRSMNGHWFAVFGSGPTGPIDTRQFLGRSDQNLRLFVVNLKSGVVVREIDTGISQAFAGSMYNSTADFDLDYQDDAVYLGYVRRDGSGGWTEGGVGRLLTNEDPDPANWVFRRVIDGIGPVTSAVARLQNNIFHSNWLYFGTGRYFYELPTGGDDPTSQRNLYGIKDPCFNLGNTIDASCTDQVDPSDLTNVDNTVVSADTANSAAFKGWKINLDLDVSVDYDGTGSRDYRPERVITDPLATTSGLVFFTTYRPYGDDCALGGKSFLWATLYNTGGAPAPALLKGKALVQVSTASIEQLDLSTAFQGDASLHKGGRRSFAMEGVPPTAQGLSLLSPPPPVKRLLHIRER